MLFKLLFATLEKRSNKFICSCDVVEEVLVILRREVPVNANASEHGAAVRDRIATRDDFILVEMLY